MTQRINSTILDEFFHNTIINIINQIKNDQFKFSPGRSVKISKSHGGTRPLTLASPFDKLVQEVMRMILKAIFKSTYSTSSHGFRPGRGCHTALREIKSKFEVAS